MFPRTVLIVSDLFHPYVGGAEISTHIVSSFLARRGVRVIVLTHRLSGTTPSELRDGILIIRKKFIYGSKKLYGHGLIPYPLISHEVARILKKGDIDIVHAQHSFAPPVVEASARFEVPSFITVRDYWPVCFKRSCWNGASICLPPCNEEKLRLCLSRGRGLKRLAYSAFPLVANYIHKLQAYREGSVRRANGVITISNTVRNMIEKSGIKRDIRTLYNPIIPSNHPHYEYQSNSSTFKIAYFGRLISYKGIFNLLEAFKEAKTRNSDLKLIYIGDGEDKLELIKRIEMEGLTEMVYVFRQLPGVTNAISKFDVIVAPSLWPDPFSRVVVEAMACGRAVIASNYGGPSEYIENGVNGFLVDPNDPSQLADLLLSLSENRERLKKVGNAARVYALSKFDANKNVDALLGMYEEARN